MTKSNNQQDSIVDDLGENNLEEATEIEKEESEQNKESLTNKVRENKGDKTTSSIPVEAVISTWFQDQTQKQLAINGYVQGVVESGGTCKIELRGPTEASGTSESFADAKTTVCKDINIPQSLLKTGIYEAVLIYESNSYGGRSEPIEIEVNL